MQGRGSWNGSGRMTKKVKTCLGELRRGKNPKSRTYLSRRDKAKMEKTKGIEPGLIV